MSNYCTNCKWLAKQTNAGKTHWLCNRIFRWACPTELQSLCGNPTKLLQCIKENRCEPKNKSEVHKLVTEHGRAMQFMVDKMLKQQEKKMTTEEMIKVMQAYVDGKNLQYRNKTTGMDWNDVTNPAWEWYDYEYRIKPEPKYRPLKPEELIELKGKWLKCKNGGNIYMCTGVTDIRILLAGSFYYPKALLDNWTYEDGTPVGKLEE